PGGGRRDHRRPDAAPRRVAQDCAMPRPKLLGDDEITAAPAHLPGWGRAHDALLRTAQLPSLPAAIAVADRVAAIAEERDHHPDIDIRWRTLTFRCSTHSEGGITELDVALAKAISEEIGKEITKDVAAGGG